MFRRLDSRRWTRGQARTPERASRAVLSRTASACRQRRVTVRASFRPSSLQSATSGRSIGSEVEMRLSGCQALPRLHSGPARRWASFHQRCARARLMLPEGSRSGARPAFPRRRGSLPAPPPTLPPHLTTLEVDVEPPKLTDGPDAVPGLVSSRGTRGPATVLNCCRSDCAYSGETPLRSRIQSRCVASAKIGIDSARHRLTRKSSLRGPASGSQTPSHAPPSGKPPSPSLFDGSGSGGAESSPGSPWGGLQDRGPGCPETALDRRGIGRPYTSRRAWEAG